MIIKNIFAVFLFSFFISACSIDQSLVKNNIIENKADVREAVSDTLISSINHILFLLKQNDLDSLNSIFINPSFGFYEILKDEEKNKITFQQKIKLDEISDDIDSFDIKEEEAIFNCSPMNDAFFGWNKEGVFLSPNTKPYLSQLMKEANLTEINKYKEEDIKRALFIEKTSYEVTIPYNIIFYITNIDKKWYITLIDKVITDCSKN
jgi:hypothetical protein